MPNFSSLAGLEVPEKFGAEWVGWGGRGGFQVTTMSNLNKVAFELLWVELSSGELHWVLTITFKEQEINNYLTTAVRAIMGPSLNPKKGRRPFTEKKNNELKWQLGYSQLIDQYKVLEAAKHLPILRNPAHPKVLLICWSSHFTALLKKNCLQTKNIRRVYQII